MHVLSKAEHWRNCIRCGVGQALLTVGLLLSVFLANTGAVSARTLEVWPGGKIQDAINAAWTDDTILVHSGTYNECLNWNSKSLHLKADVENGPVVVDAGGHGACLTVINPFNPNLASMPKIIVDGFTFQGGAADRGGGANLSNCNATLTNNTISGNTASSFGGGVFLDYGIITLTGNIISGNAASTSDGGGVFFWGGIDTFKDNIISGNTAYLDGGGIYGYNISNVTLTGNTISGNTANRNGGGVYCGNISDFILTDNNINSNTAYKYGGGVYVSNSSDTTPSANAIATLTDNTINDNTGSWNGGGIYISNYSNTTLTANAITGNTTTWTGGGIFLYNYLATSLATLVDNAISGNRTSMGGPGGIFLYNNGSTRVTNNTLAFNQGGGLVSNAGGIGKTDITNCILWGNTNIDLYSKTPATYSDIGVGNTIGLGNITCDPRFASNPSPGPDGIWCTGDDSPGDLHLQPGSPCINTGSNNAPALPLTDKDGNQRQWGASVDMGAYECQNVPPIAMWDGVKTNEDTVVSGNVLANDKDADHDVLSAVLRSSPEHGTVVLNSNGSFTYTPNANYNGPDHFTYRANDGKVDSNEAIVSIIVLPVNDPPVVSVGNPTVTVDEGTTAVNSDRWSDVDGDDVQLSASVGTVLKNADGTWKWSFATKDGPADSQTVTITADDRKGGITTGSFKLAVNNVAPSDVKITGPASGILYPVDTTVPFTGSFVDPGILDTHTATWTITNTLRACTKSVRTGMLFT